MAVTHVFLIDVSNAALGSGATAAACQCVEQVGTPGVLCVVLCCFLFVMRV
jgi:hypothetical protein